MVNEFTPEIPRRAPATAVRRPRLGFIGLGWIGAARMKTVAEDGSAEIAGLMDSAPDAARGAAAHAPSAVVAPDLESLLALDLDGVVIATPTALHAPQAISCLGSGAAVFCQKPLGRSAVETTQVITAARSSNRLLAVDMCYRFVRAFTLIKEIVRSGEVGEIYACDLVFHNAYGPDKPWYYDRKLSGGGCVVDLGIHLIDLALWFLDAPPVRAVLSRRFAQGRALSDGDPALEDYAVARLDFASGASAALACSWNLPAGKDAIIRAAFYGTKGGVAVRNVKGSFYDFRAERYRRTATEILDDAPDAWGGRALAAWVNKLATSRDYDPAIESTGTVAAVIDAIYGREAALRAEEIR
jgi:predicted dehydrogenase